MKFQSILAIYVLFWTLSLFVVLPIGVRTPEEEGVECPPGHAPSAPHRFSFGKAALRATIVSAAAFILFFANYHFGWITIGDLEWARPPGR
jgi:predicted secreted protein